MEFRALGSIACFSQYVTKEVGNIPDEKLISCPYCGNKEAYEGEFSIFEVAAKSFFDSYSSEYGDADLTIIKCSRCKGLFSD